MIYVVCILLKKAQNTAIYMQDSPLMVKFIKWEIHYVHVHISCIGAVFFVCKLLTQ